MIIDFHTHIFPDRIKKNRAAYFHNEPGFELLYDSPKSKIASAEDITSSMDKSGIDISVVFGFPWKNPETAKMHNDYIIEAVNKYSGRLKGLACFDPSWKNAANEAERCLDAGLSGVGELAFYKSGINRQAAKDLEPVMKICFERDVPVLIHANEPIGHQYPGKTKNTLADIYSLALHFPENKLIMAHWGGGIFFYMLLKKEVQLALKNVYYDTAASPFLYKADIFKIAPSIAGKDKIVFGTDYPLIQPGRYFKEIEASGLGEKDSANMLGLNAARLLKITHRGHRGKGK
jgi:predicted TIM-barrel fold metal-dependent hydrolase